MTNEYLRKPLRSTLSPLSNFIRSKPLGTFGALVVIIMIVLAIWPTLFAPADPYKTFVGPRFSAPSMDHPFGTDGLGRDILSRTVYGARFSVYIGLTSVLIGITGALIIAVISGYYGALLDLLLQRVVDTLLAVPGLVLALFVLALFKPSPETMILTLAVVFMAPSIRTIRAAVLSVKQMPYIESARAIGASTPRILIRHIVPQIMALYMVLISLTIGGAIIAETSLSFLGLGLSPDDPTWGNLVQKGTRDLFLVGVWQPIPPAIAIALCVFGFNLLGDALRDVLDPRLRGSGVRGIRR